MAEEVQDIRIRLTAEDRASDPTRRLLREVAALEKKLKSGFGKSKIIGSIIDDASIAAVKKGGKAIDGLTQKSLQWARGQREMGKMTYDAYDRMEKAIQKNLATYTKATSKKKDLMRKDLTDQVKKAQAFRHILNQEHRERLRLESSFQEKLARIGDAQHRRQERAEIAHQRTIARHRRSMWNNIRSTPGRMMNRLDGNGFFNSPAFYAIAAGTGAVAMGRSSVRSATDLDKAETYARMHMDQSKVNARDLRNNWAIPRSVDLGQDPSRLFMTAVDASKAGVPDALAAGTAEMVTQIAKVFGVEIEQAMDGMGFAIAQEIGAGRMKGDDLTGIRRIGNITAYLAGKTAARPDQMLSFLRTGLGSGAMLGMDQQSTLAFGAAAVQAGAQGQQAARMLGSMAEDINNLTTRAKDIRRKHTRSENDKMFLRLPSLLGYGSYGGLQDSFKKSPNTAIFDLLKSFGKIKDPQMRNRAMTAMFGADFARFTANMISSPGILDESQALAKEAGSQASENDWLATSWLEFQKSLEFFLGRVKATWTVLKAELGDVLKPFIEQFSSWVGDWYKAVRTGGLKERFKAVLDGLTTGFLGKPGTFRDLLDTMFGKPGEGDAGSADKYFKFAKGFAEGIKSVIGMITGAMKGIANALGVDSGDPEAMGKLVAQILGLTVALHLMRPVISVLGLIVDFVGMIAAIFGAGGWVASLAGLLSMFQNTGVSDKAIRKKGEAYEDWQKRRRELKKNSSYEGATDFSGARKHHVALKSSVDDLTEQLEKFGGKIEKASFMTGTLGVFSTKSGGGGLQGGGLAGLSSAPSIGGVPPLLNNVPGTALPNMGGSSGPMIKRGSTSFSGGKGFTAKAPQIMRRLMDDFGLSKEQAAGIVGNLGHESGGFSLMQEKNPLGGGRGGFGWAQWTGSRRREYEAWAAARGLDPKSDEANYGFLKHELSTNYRGAIGAVKGQNSVAGSMRAFEGAYEKAGVKNYGSRLNYSNQALSAFSDPSGVTSGVPTGTAGGDPVSTAEQFLGANEYRDTKKIADFIGRDPRGRVNAWCARFVNTALAKNGIKGTGSDMALSFKNWGEAVTDGVKRGDIMVRPTGGGSGHVGFATGQTKDGMIEMLSGNQGNEVRKTWEPMGKYQLRRGASPVGQVPSPVQNVPPPAVQQMGGPQFAGGGAGGPVAIHINGSSHDPEALATLVQRRIDEAMNWRTHDIDHESV